MAEERNMERNMNDIITSLRSLAQDEDFAYTLRDYAFRLMNLYRVDKELYDNELAEFLYFLKTTEKVSQDVLEKIVRMKWSHLRNVLVSIIPYLNIKKAAQPTQGQGSEQRSNQG